MGDKKVFIKQIKETEQTHTQKSVQMHSLARNFASQMKDKIVTEQIEGFGQTFERRKIFMGKMDDGKYVTIEFIDDDFVKYINNNGKLCENGDVCDKAQAFAHFTYEKSQGKLIVLDIQGAGYTLHVPEIATLDLLGDEGNYQFCTGNLSHICDEKLFWWSSVRQVLQSIEVEIKTNNISHLCNKLYFLLRIICLHVVAETKPLIGFITK